MPHKVSFPLSLSLSCIPSLEQKNAAFLLALLLRPDAAFAVAIMFAAAAAAPPI